MGRGIRVAGVLAIVLIVRSVIWLKTERVPEAGQLAVVEMVPAASATPEVAAGNAAAAGANSTAAPLAAGSVAPMASAAPGAVTEVVPGAAAAPMAGEQATAAGGGISRAQAMVELDKVHHMIGSYHTLMGQDPVGTNAEIMRELMGANPHQAVLGPPPGQSLNAKGELVDPWGTPYFFHQLSGDDMEIISAGPDKIMGTKDDLEMP